MSQSESQEWGAWRIRRLLQILELKTLGLTDVQVAERMPISRATVSRELNSPQAVEIGRMLRRRAEGMVWPLVEKQLRQIEGDKSLTPGQKLIYRGKLIGILASLVSKQVEQKISGELQQKIEAKMEVTREVAGLEEYIDVVVEQILEEQVEGDRNSHPGKDTGEPVDPVEPDADQP